MTRRTAVASCLAASAALVLAVPRDGRAAEPADLVLTNAVVHTVDAKRPRAEAVAVRGRRIVAVGTSAEVQALVGPKTRVLDLRGRTVVPGFDDSHAHLLGIGFARLDVDLVGTRSFAEVVERVAAAVKARRPGRVDPRPRLARGQVGRAGAGLRARLSHPRRSHRGLAREPRGPRSRRRARRPRQCEGDGPRGNHARHEGPRGRRDHPRCLGRGDRRVRGQRRAARRGARALARRRPARARARDGRVPRQGRHQPDRRGRGHGRGRPLQGGGGGGNAAHAALRDGGGPPDDEGPGAAGGGPGERHARRCAR